MQHNYKTQLLNDMRFPKIWVNFWTTLERLQVINAPNLEDFDKRYDKRQTDKMEPK